MNTYEGIYPGNCQRKASTGVVWQRDHLWYGTDQTESSAALEGSFGFWREEGATRLRHRWYPRTRGTPIFRTYTPNCSRSNCNLFRRYSQSWNEFKSFRPENRRKIIFPLNFQGRMQNQWNLKYAMPTVPRPCQVRRRRISDQTSRRSWQMSAGTWEKTIPDIFGPGPKPGTILVNLKR